MNTLEIQKILTNVLPTCRVNFLGVFAQDTIPDINSQPSPLCFVSNTHPSNKPGEHWVAFFYENSHLEFFDSYGLSPSMYDFKFQIPMRMNHQTLQSLDSNVCGHYCIFYLYHRSRGKSLSQIVSSFSTRDLSWNDNSVTRFLSKLLPSPPCSKSSCACSQSCMKRHMCNK